MPSSKMINGQEKIIKDFKEKIDETFNKCSNKSELKIFLFKDINELENNLKILDINFIKCINELVDNLKEFVNKQRNIYQKLKNKELIKLLDSSLVEYYNKNKNIFKKIKSIHNNIKLEKNQSIEKQMKLKLNLNKNNISNISLKKINYIKPKKHILFNSYSNLFIKKSKNLINNLKSNSTPCFKFNKNINKTENNNLNDINVFILSNKVIQFLDTLNELNENKINKKNILLLKNDYLIKKKYLEKYVEKIKNIEIINKNNSEYLNHINTIKKKNKELNIKIFNLTKKRKAEQNENYILIYKIYNYLNHIYNELYFSKNKNHSKKNLLEKFLFKEKENKEKIMEYNDNLYKKIMELFESNNNNLDNFDNLNIDIVENKNENLLFYFYKLFIINYFFKKLVYIAL